MQLIPDPKLRPEYRVPTRRVTVRVAKDEGSQVASSRLKRTRRGRARSLAATVTLAGATLFVLVPSLPALAYASTFHAWQLPIAGNYCVNSGVINNGWLNLGQPSMNSWNNVATYSRPTFAYTSCWAHKKSESLRLRLEWRPVASRRRPSIRPTLPTPRSDCGPRKLATGTLHQL